MTPTYRRRDMGRIAIAVTGQITIKGAGWRASGQVG
jgi:hypothetical protein